MAKRSGNQKDGMVFKDGIWLELKEAWVIEALGADVEVKKRKAKRGGYNLEIILRPSGIRKMVRRLIRPDLDRYAMIGKASGEDIFHCLWMGARHYRNFWERIIGFDIGDSPEPVSGDIPRKTTFCFYEKADKSSRKEQSNDAV
jgi:hypothetical protein